MRWVIIGSSGYIGGALCKQLAAQGHSVLSVSRRASGPAGCEHLQIETFSHEAFGQVFLPADQVVYLAGVSSVAECAKRPAQARWLNCELPMVLLRLADSAGVASFLYFSSVKARRTPSGILADEASGVPATDVYGASKWEAERALFAVPVRCRLNVIRPAAVYGDMAAVTGAVAATAGKKVIRLKKILGLIARYFPAVPGTGFRSVVSLVDLLRAVTLIESQRCDREVFIAAEPRYYDIAEMVAAVTGRRPKVSRWLTHLMRVPAGRRFGELQDSEVYSAGHLKRSLKWGVTQRYGDFLRGK